MSNNEKMIYLNTPITTKENDIIGLDVCADKLSDAIDEGAQMIAITSPFGSGKTSVIDLLQEKRQNNKKEYILKIPMWSQLHQLKNSANELHRNFLYQISSLINHKRGTYVSRRLSNNYGLLTLHANKNRFWLLFTISLLFVCMAWGVHHFSESIENFLPVLEEKSEYVMIALIIMAIYIGILVLTRAEIIFSSQKSENERIIDEDEIIDLYRAEILKYETRIGHWIRNITKGWKHRPLRGYKYIVVVEDLDRTDDGKSVIEFLTELRKYYLPTNYSKSRKALFKNEVVFVVNIKPESVLFSEIKSKKVIPADSKEKEDHVVAVTNNKNAAINNDKKQTIEKDNFSAPWIGNHLFAKIFDYILDLQTINIVDYKTVLEGLLKSKITTLDKFGFDTSQKLTDIPGMLWIIRGKTLDIREIKNRLNKAFLIFETLQNRFSEESNQISFEKCAIVAYLTTAFEHEFHLTGDTAFQRLIEFNMFDMHDRNHANKRLSKESCAKILHTDNDDYANAVFELVRDNLIDDTYRMYFYNYPQNSRMYSYSELIVQQAILYDEMPENLEEAIDNVLRNNSDIIADSFEQLKKLNLRLPQFVFQNENLYMQALSHAADEVIFWLDKLDLPIDKANSEIMRILSYDQERKIYNKDLAKRFCNSWEQSFNEKSLLKLRKCLCGNFPNEISWYKQLFFGAHGIITVSEMRKLSLVDSIELINIDDDNFDLSHVKCAVESFLKTEGTPQEESQKLKEFLLLVKSRVDSYELAQLYLSYMEKINRIIPEFESVIVELIQREAGKDEEKKQNSLFTKYQNLINQVDSKALSEATLKNISNIEKFGGYDKYSNNVAKTLYIHGYYAEYIMIQLQKEEYINFDNKNILSAVEKYINWFSQDATVFNKLRSSIIKGTRKLLPQYKFLFNEDLPAVSNVELELLRERNDIGEDDVLELAHYKK